MPRLPAARPVHCEQDRPGPDPAPRDALLRAARQDGAARPDLRADYKKYRPNIERVISQVASRGGWRLKLRYLGTARNNAWLKTRTVALNLRTLISRGLEPPERNMGTGLTARDCNFNGVTPDKQGYTSDRRDSQSGRGAGAAGGG